MGVSRERIETLFNEALQLAPEERKQFLASACGSDSRSHDELVSLLTQHEKTDPILVQPFVTPDFLLELQAEWKASLPPGETLAGRFRIVRLLASGGMGDVYEAEDVELGDQVALKTIRTDVAATNRMLARFKKEIQLAKRISHPNVCRIHDLGIHESPRGTLVFLTMELLSGETLAQVLEHRRLALDEIHAIAKQIAAGLDAAHQVGVVHRDLKTSNVFVVGHDTTLRVVITDFGIAHAGYGKASATQLTLTGEIVGTPDYMAPEQVRGEPTGPFTDVYAFGLMLHEMVTGQKPFAADTPLAAVVKRLQSAAPSARLSVPDLPAKWENAILRCLNSAPVARFQSAGDVIRFLDATDGTKFSKLRAWPSRRTLWIAVASIFALVALFGAVLLVRRTRTNVPPPAATVPAAQTSSDRARMHYERALYFWNVRTQDSFLKAIDEYQQAIEADPGFASAYAGIAWVYAMQSGFKTPKEVFPLAKNNAETAIRLDPQLALAHAALAFVKFYYEWDWKEAEAEYKTAITLDGKYASAHSNYAILLAVRNRIAEAEQQAKLAERADPVSAAVATGLGRIHYWSGNNKLAVQQFRSVLTMYPQFLEAHLSLASALESIGDSEGAVRQISYVLSDTLYSSALADLGYLYAKMHDELLARSMLEKIEKLRSEKKRYVSPCYPAIVHAALGESDQAFRLLKEGLRERTFEMVYLNLNPEYSPLRKDRRWVPLVRSVGLTD